MDVVFIKGLAVDAVVGICDWERIARQRVEIDIELVTDISKAAASKDINDALNYKSVSDRVTEFVVESKFLLLETMAEEVANVILNEFSVKQLSLSCMKVQAMPNVAGVGVKIIRGQASDV
ncbi:MAG: dihydroneopterin aldolase [Lentisphaeria bacterium]|jgi:dihydroneopterin aldolase